MRGGAETMSVLRPKTREKRCALGPPSRSRCRSRAAPI